MKELDDMKIMESDFTGLPELHNERPGHHRVPSGYIQNEDNTLKDTAKRNITLPTDPPNEKYKNTTKAKS